MVNYIKLIRIKHWIKNFLVFFPIFFSINIKNINYLKITILAFIIFSLTSSIVYVINDIFDIEKDKKHPLKKNRPLASGKITIKNALFVILTLIVLDIFGILFLYKKTNNLFIIVIPIFYIIINIFYSKILKNIPILDILIIVIGYILRIVYGAVAIDIYISKWLYLMTMFGSFYLGFGKRRNEIKKNGIKSRKVLSLYTSDFLDKNMYVSFTLAIVSYTLWCIDTNTINRIGNDYIFWTIPIIMTIFQLYSLKIEGNSYGDPVEVILSDKKLLFVIIFYLIILIIILYFI